MRPLAIDIFAGAGGMSLGFEQAGFEVAAAVEVDPVHCAVHAFNFPRTAAMPYSVTDLSGRRIRQFAKIGKREIHCVFGGAPCQGFSLIGQRALDDPRNHLAKDFVRIVAELEATSFVFENVKGITVGKHKKFLDELIKEFENSGYEVLSPWRVLNAAHFGVPQFRERLILMGVRRGCAMPKYPEKITKIAGRNEMVNLPEGPSCLEAIGDLPEADQFPELLCVDFVASGEFGPPSSYARELRCTEGGSWHLGYPRVWNSAVMTSSMRTKHTHITRRRFAAVKGGDVEPISRFYKLSMNGVCNTLRAGTDGSRGAFTSPRPIHYSAPRCVTVREMARLHGFPDWFRFHATKWHGARQVGNSVPPPLARAVAFEIAEAVSVKSIAASENLELGEPRFLTMNVSEAARNFGVEPPRMRRGYASGASKRKQIDIERAHAMKGM